jgi:hypothetical protein
MVTEEEFIHPRRRVVHSCCASEHWAVGMHRSGCHRFVRTIVLTRVCAIVHTAHVRWVSKASVTHSCERVCAVCVCAMRCRWSGISNVESQSARGDCEADRCSFTEQ